METPFFKWVWRIEPNEFSGRSGEVVVRFVGSVIGVRRDTGEKFCEFSTSHHKDADKAHQELMKIIERTERTIDEQNQLYGPT